MKHMLCDGNRHDVYPVRSFWSKGGLGGVRLLDVYQMHTNYIDTENLQSTVTSATKFRNAGKKGFQYGISTLCVLAVAFLQDLFPELSVQLST